MCLLSFAWQPDSHTPLIMVSNRDEFHHRPTAVSEFWPQHPHVLAGKDLTAGGTWMGVTTTGRFAALTNVRQLPSSYEGAISRGALVKNYLIGDHTPERYLNQINGEEYDGFNLIVGDRNQCWYLSNRPLAAAPEKLAAGIYGLSNAQLNTPWPKTLHAKEALQQWINHSHSNQQPLYRLLQSNHQFAPDLLPDTGIGEPWETLLSSPFIISPEYGTRACTALRIHQVDIHWQEATISKNGDQLKLVEFNF